jgi:hypothetical protein
MGRSSDEILKLLSASNLLLEQSIKRVEEEHGIQLRERDEPDATSTAVYYPQFEQEVRDEARTSARHYELFYCLETATRRIVRDKLKEAKTTAWWKEGVPPAIQTEVANRMQRDIDSGVTLRSEDPLDFTTFGELSQIITGQWDLFGDVFTSRKAVEKVMANLNILRGPIAHCSPLAPDEVVRLELTVRDFFRTMGS